MFKLPNDSIFYTIEKTIKAYRKFAQRNIKNKKIKITIDQALTLLFIANKPELQQKEIAKLIFKENASLTRIIELLSKKEYINRSFNENDRRRSKLEISKKGKNTIKNVIPIIKKNRVDALKGISKNELLQLNETLNKIYKNCTQEN